MIINYELKKVKAEELQKGQKVINLGIVETVENLPTSVKITFTKFIPCVTIETGSTIEFMPYQILLIDNDYKYED